MKNLFSTSGIECACLATSIRYCLVDKVARGEMIETTRRFLVLAHDIGCQRIRVFGGKPDREIERETAIAIVGEALSILAPEAEAAKVQICLETHDFFSRADMAAAAVRKANSLFIRINWDIMHPFTQGMSIQKAFNEVKDLVAHCHIHDGTYDAERKPTLALMGEGEIPYAEAVQLLASINYPGYLSGEYIRMWPPEVVLPHDIRVLKSYLGED
ncbi:MAG: sugar phosphate isomerase/epimerase [Candidatus Omnitrophica bacterium]|nr:sugar phosphate isomerase/epimerase [Candidatus Omnitrophota bacterium]